LKDQRSQNVVAKSKGDEYGRGVGLHGKVKEKQIAVVGKKRIQAKRARPTKCKCGLSDHLRITYKLCELNPKNIALAIEAAKAKAQESLIMPTLTHYATI